MAKPFVSSPFKNTINFYGESTQLTAKAVLTSSKRFCIKLDKFNEDVINIFKTVPSRLYDTKTRNWSFHIKDYSMVLSKLAPLGSKIRLEKLPGFVLNCLASQTSDTEIDYDKIDPVLRETLMPFQEEGLRFGVNKGGRCLIADDMGLGKTFQALAIANYYKENWPLLIVTTASMKTVWEETIRNYLPSIPIMTLQYMISAKDYIGDSKVIIVSHDLMVRCLEKLLEKSFGVIIIDESHVLKSFKTKCFKAAAELAKRSRRVILLSGTPALSRPSELYTQLSLIDHKFFSSFYDYSKRYCDGKNGPFGWECNGKSNLEELEVILTMKFMIRRMKEEVLKAMPNKTQEIIKLDTKLDEFSEEDKKCLLALATKYQQEKKGNKHTALLCFFSESAKIKIPSVCSYLLQILESKAKFLVFAHHQVMLNAIEELVKKKNLKYIRIDGSTTSERRKIFVSKFQCNDEFSCAILSITAANAGITLTAAQLVLFAELHWNPSIISQAEARAHRIGQEKPVVVRYLLAPGTADDSIWPLLREKQKTLKAVGLCKDSFDDVSIKKQDSSVEVQNLNITVLNSSKSDIRDYFSPSKKPKLSESEVDDMFNDGMDEILCQHVDAQIDCFNDGLDELFCDIDC